MRSRSALGILLLALTTIRRWPGPTGPTRACCRSRRSAPPHRVRLRRRPVVGALDGNDVRRLTTTSASSRTRPSRPTARRSRSAPSTTATPTCTSSRSTAARRAADLASRAPTSSRASRRTARASSSRRRARSSPTGTRSSSRCRSSGGVETQLPIPYARAAAYSPDGTRIAYNPLGAGVPAVEALPRRHGLAHLVSTTCRRTRSRSRRSRRTRANDVDPNWVGDTLYFRSDRDGEFNLFAYDPGRRRSSSSRSTTTSRSSTWPPAAATSSRAGRLPAPARSGDRQVAQARRSASPRICARRGRAS